MNTDTRAQAQIQTDTQANLKHFASAEVVSDADL